MDDLFLRVLRARPELAPDLFLTLFTRVDPVCIARFMSDRAHPADYAAIVGALPPAPFLRELIRGILRDLGSMRDSTGEGSR